MRHRDGRASPFLPEVARGDLAIVFGMTASDVALTLARDRCSPQLQMTVTNQGNLDIALMTHFGQNRSVHIHRTLLSDRIRTLAFRDAIKRSVKPGDTVIDLGTGSGVLSVFACQAGADRVYALDMDRGILAFAEELAKANGCQKKITFLPKNSRTTKLPAKADVLVSECIGWMMYGGSMISAVTDARDRFLKPGGIVLPRKLLLYAAPIESRAHYEYVNAHVLESLYDLDFKALQDASANSLYLTVLPENGVIAEPALVEEADVAGGHPNEMIDTRVEFTISRAGRELHGFGLWFTADLCDGISFGSAPSDPPTVWKQAFIGCGEAIPLRARSKVVLDLRLTRTLKTDMRDIASFAWDVEVHAPGGRSAPIRRSFSTKSSFKKLQRLPEFKRRMSGKLWNKLKAEQVRIYEESRSETESKAMTLTRT